VGNEEQSAAFAHQLSHPLHALCLKARIANCERFVHYEHVWVQMRRNCEPQAQLHSGRIHFDRRVERLRELCEPHDLVEPAPHLHLLIPRIRPYSQMFSRAVSSGCTPEPTSISAPTRPRTRTRPDVGREIREMILRAVVFPAPFGPMIANDSPG
jgi:hypothetical protein